MSGDEVVLDSVILIDHLNGHAAATAYLEGLVGCAWITAITRVEVLTGYDAEARPPVVVLLDGFPMIPVGRELADLAAELRRSHGWRLPDAIQAAAARSHGIRLVTRDVKHFPPDAHAFVTVPYVI